MKERLKLFAVVHRLSNIARVRSIEEWSVQHLIVICILVFGPLRRFKHFVDEFTVSAPFKL